MKELSHINYYTVTFETHGGTAVEAITQKEGTEVARPADPALALSVFAGWFDAATGGSAIAWPVTLNGDMTVHAQWTPITYTIAYDDNGADTGAAPASQTKTVGTALTLPTNSGNLVKSGSYFWEWNTSSDGSGTTYRAGTSLTGDLTMTDGATVTLYAKWNTEPAVGATGPAGGIIFYDKGSASSGWRYLEVAPADLGQYQWGGYGTPCGVTATGIGDGAANTAALTAGGHGHAHPAAQACAEYSAGGYSDWFLPSKDELSELYLQRAAVGISSGYYWSSSESNASYAWVQGFGYGVLDDDYKNFDYSVRAVRAF